MSVEVRKCVTFSQHRKRLFLKLSSLSVHVENSELWANIMCILCVLCNIVVLGPALFTNTLHVGTRHFNAFAANGDYLMNYLLWICPVWTVLSIAGHLD